MASVQSLRRGVVRGVLFVFVLGSCLPLLAQERKQIEEKQKESQAGERTVRLPLELTQEKTYTFAVTKLATGSSQRADRTRDEDEDEEDGSPNQEDSDRDRAPRTRSRAGEASGAAERATYRLQAKSSASAGETSVEVTVSQGSTFGSSNTQGALRGTPEDRRGSEEKRASSEEKRASSEEGRGSTYRITVGENGEIRSDGAAGQQRAVPEAVKQHVALILGQGLHKEPLSAGQAYGHEAFSGEKVPGSRSSPFRRSTEPSRSETRSTRSANSGAATSDMDSGQIEGLAFVFRGKVEREGKELAFFDIIEADREGSPPGRSGQSGGEATRAKDRSGGALRSGTFQQRADNCGSVTYNVEDGLIEQLSLSRPSHDKGANSPEAERSRPQRSTEGKARVTLLIRRIEASTGGPDASPGN